MQHWWNDIERGKPEYLEVSPPKTHTHTHTRTVLGTNPAFTKERQATNHLSRNTVHPVTSLSAYGIYLNDIVSTSRLRNEDLHDSS